MSFFPLCASYQILKIGRVHAPGMRGTGKRSRHASRHVRDVPWCMSGSLTSRFFFKSAAGENDTGIPRACTPAILHIWQEAHAMQGFRMWDFIHRGQDKLTDMLQKTFFFYQNCHSISWWRKRSWQLIYLLIRRSSHPALRKNVIYIYNVLHN